VQPVSESDREAQTPSLDLGWTETQREWLRQLFNVAQTWRQRALEFEARAERADAAGTTDGDLHRAAAEDCHKAADHYEAQHKQLSFRAMQANQVEAARVSAAATQEAAAAARDAAEAGKRSACWTALAALAALATAVFTAGATLGWWGPGNSRTAQPAAIQGQSEPSDPSERTPDTANPQAPEAGSSKSRPQSALPAPSPDRSVGSTLEPEPSPAPANQPQGSPALRPADS